MDANLPTSGYQHEMSFRNQRFLLRQAEESYRNGKLQRALQSLDKAKSIDPTTNAILYYRGFVLAHLGSTDEAMKEFNAVIDSDPHHAHAYFGRAFLHNLKQQYELAYQDAEQAILLGHPNEESYFQRGVALLYLGCFSEALEDFNKVIAAKHRDKSPHIHRAAIYVWQNNNQQAAADFDIFLKFKPDQAYVYTRRAAVRYNLGDHAGYLADIAKARKMGMQFDQMPLEPGYVPGPDEIYPPTYININFGIRGRLSFLMRHSVKLCKAGEYARAMKVLDDAQRLFPQDAAVSYHRGLVYEEQERNEEAVAEFTTTITLRPDYFLPYRHRAEMYNRLKNYPLALADAEMAIKLDADHIESYFHRAMAKFKMGELDEALRDFTYVIDKDEHTQTARLHRGSIYANRGKYQEALVDFNRLLELVPNYGVGYFYRGHVKYALGDKAGFDADIAKAREIGCDLPLMLSNSKKK